MKKILEVKGITLITLVVTIIVLLILAGVSIAMLTGQNRILTKAGEAKTETRGAAVQEACDLWKASNKADSYTTTKTAQSLEEVLNDLVSQGNLTTDEKDKIIGNEDKGIDATGQIKIGTRTINFEIELAGGDGSWNGTVNSPKLMTGMTGIYWNESEEEVNVNSDNIGNWYDYSSQKWANAKTSDGSYWVWIPRYEYKIDSTNKTIDVKFIQTSVTSDKVDDGYILQPAFGTDIDNGGWSTDLPGFWVAKYAAGYQNSTVGETTKEVQNSNLKYTQLNGYKSNFLTASLSTDTNISYPVFKPNTYAYNIISVGDAWLLVQEID